MSTKQDVIRPDNLNKEKKDIIENSDENVCLSPSSVNNLNKTIDESKPKSTFVKKSRCFVDGCNKKIAKIIGDCKFCNNKFCELHRLPEIHVCSKMNDVKSKSKNILENRLLSEKCISNKLDSI